MGYAQGVMVIAYAIGNIVFQTGVQMPDAGPIVGNYLGGVLIQEINANYGSYWTFGIILALLGLILIARGEPKPRDPSERIPLLQEPLSVKTTATDSRGSASAEGQ